MHTSGSPAISRKLAVLTPPVVAPAVASLFSRLIRERSTVSRRKRPVTIASRKPAGGGTFVTPTELGIRAREATMPLVATEIPNPIEQRPWLGCVLRWRPWKTQNLDSFMTNNSIVMNRDDLRIRRPPNPECYCRGVRQESFVCNQVEEVVFSNTRLLA